MLQSTAGFVIVIAGIPGGGAGQRSFRLRTAGIDAQAGAAGPTRNAKIKWQGGAWNALCGPTDRRMRTMTALSTGEPRLLLWRPLRPFRLPKALVLLLSAALVIGSGYLTYEVALRTGLAQASSEAENRLQLLAGTLEARVERFRYLPMVLAQAEAVRLLYEHPNSAQANATNQYLEYLNGAAGSADLFVIDSAGRTLAASNYRDATSFVGENYSFRPYFNDALRDGEGRYYAIGVTTGQPGYFLSYRVKLGDRIAGVAVVKIDLGPLENEWMRTGEPIAIVDASDVIFLTNHPQWKYRPLAGLSEAQLQLLAQTQQYGGAIGNVEPLLSAERRERGVRIVQVHNLDKVPEGEYAIFSKHLPAHRWTLLVFSKIGEVYQFALIIATTMALCVLTVLLLMLIFYQRRQVIRSKLEAKNVLERRVAERTAELRAANARLSSEIDERIRAERDLRTTQGELIQAAKLASLGQALAGVTHEMDQPLAALGTYLASTRILLDRNELGNVLSNLDMISAIVERMGKLTQHLKTFARKEPGVIHETDFVQSISNAMRLLEYRLRDGGIETIIKSSEPSVYVLGNAIRLEQVVLNLVSNAIDAMRSCVLARLTVDLQCLDGFALLMVSDTGNGITRQDLACIFDPFFTTKGVGEGLGLGLSISYGIIHEMNGEFTVESEIGVGTTFFVKVPLADRKRMQSSSVL